MTLGASSYCCAARHLSRLLLLLHSFLAAIAALERDEQRWLRSLHSNETNNVLGQLLQLLIECSSRCRFRTSSERAASERLVFASVLPSRVSGSCSWGIRTRPTDDLQDTRAHRLLARRLLHLVPVAPWRQKVSSVKKKLTFRTGMS